MVISLLKSSLGRLRIIAFLEGISYLLLVGIAVPLKWIWDMPDAVRVLGPIHGGLFTLYVLLLMMIKFELDWSWKKTGIAFVASIVPFGTFWADAKLFR